MNYLNVLTTNSCYLLVLFSLLLNSINFSFFYSYETKIVKVSLKAKFLLAREYRAIKTSLTKTLVVARLLTLRALA